MGRKKLSRQYTQRDPSPIDRRLARSVANIVMKLAHTLMIEILIKSGLSSLVMEPVDIGTATKLSDIQLPFFVDETDLKAEAQSSA